MRRYFPDFTTHQRLAWIVLVASFFVTGIAWYLSDQAVREKAEVRFGLQAVEISKQIEKRMLEYETALRGGAGVFDQFGKVSRAQWRGYVESLRVQVVFPGIQGLGHAVLLRADDVAAHMAAVRAEGFPDYAVRPPGRRDPTSAIVYLEPFDWRNRRAFGYDMYSEPVRRQAMQRAIDTGLPSISGRVTLVQETDRDVQSGVLMYVPLYRSGRLPETVEERRAAARGFVYAPFRMRDLMKGILGRDTEGLTFDIHDGEKPSHAGLLYSSADGGGALPAETVRGGLREEFRILIAQRTWVIRVQATPGFRAPDEEMLPLVVAGTGVAIDLFLFFIIGALGRRKAEVERLVEQRTTELQAAKGQAEATNSALLMDEARLNAMLELSESAAGLSEKEVQQHGLEAAQRLTGSAIAYLHFVNDDQESLKLSTWSANTLKFCTAAHADHYPLAEAGVWADAARQRRPIVHNDYQSLPDRRGYPPGHAHLVRHLAVPVIEGGLVRLIIGVGNKETDYDATDQRQLQLIGDSIWRIVGQRRLLTHLEQARDDAQAASRAKTAFLANMSHELRTPMNAIFGFTSLAQIQVRDEKVREQLRKVEEASHHLLGIIDDVLDVANIEAGRLRLEQAPFQVADVIADAVRPLMGQAQAKGLRLVSDVPDAVQRLAVLGDPSRLRQILLNLLGNAVKFSERGDVVLRASVLDSWGTGVLLRWEVQDSGIGIDERDQERLFLPFEQVDSTSTRRHGGTGLGLAISRSLVTLMGGEIGVSSRRGEGATFWFTTRFERFAEASGSAGRTTTAATVTDAARNSGAYAVLVEGESITLEVTRFLLEDLGFLVTAWGSLEEAEAAFAAECIPRFAVAVVDWADADGARCVRALRASPANANVPVIALVSGEPLPDRELLLAAGFDDSVRKPVNPDALRAAIDRRCGRGEGHGT